MIVMRYYGITLAVLVAFVHPYFHFQTKNLSKYQWIFTKLGPASVAQLDAHLTRPGGREFDPCQARQHSFMEIDHAIFSRVILSLPLIPEGQLSVSGERICTILVNRLED